MKERTRVVDTIGTLTLIHKALRAKDPALLGAAESVLSGLILHLRYPQAPLPGELSEALDLLTALH